MFNGTLIPENTVPMSNDIIQSEKTLPLLIYFPVILLPDRPFYNLEPKDQEIGEFCVVQGRQSTDFEAPKLCKGRSDVKRLHSKELTSPFS